jgi:plasmid stabilization system protein ParE
MKLVIRRAALAELNSIHDYISKANPFAAKSVVQRILKSSNGWRVFH